MRKFRQPGGAHNAVPERVVFGPGSLAEIAAEVAHLGARRPLILTTPGRAALGERVLDLVGSGVLLPEAVSQVPIELARQARSRAIEVDADCLVAVGGGAATGLGKGIALEHPLPIIDIPTTYSGSEMTAFCGITIDGVKRMHASRNMLASTVVYDPELTLTLPDHVTASSAMNALAHCVDAIYQPTLSPVIAHSAVEGAKVVMGALPAVLAAPADLTARAELLYGAFLSGAALAGGFTLQHAIAHTLGGSFGIEHGVAHSLVLPHTTRHLQALVPAAIERLADAVGTDDLAATIEKVIAGAGLPRSLREVGLAEEDLERAVEITMSAEPDPEAEVPVDAATVRTILKAAWDAGEGDRR